jgi:hypothetical protein
VTSPRGIAFRINRPCISRDAELPGNDIEKRAMRPFVPGQHSPWIPEIAHHHGNAKAVVIPAVLPDKGQIRLRQRVQANQLSLVFWESQQLKAL